MGTHKIYGDHKPLYFHYKNEGSLAIIGRYSAVAEFKRFKLKGILAWLIWNIVHIYFLIGFKNKTVVFLKWLWEYITNSHNEKLIISPGDSQTTE
jgi:NADH:ubiquinone reductase (H+-translocating)